MSNKTFRLAEHYLPIKHLIFNENEDQSTLQEEYGECVTECLFLSHLAENLESQSCSESLLAIASQLMDFELPQFQLPELIPLYDEPVFFQGEIVYFSNKAVVVKITSYQSPAWQILLMVVKKTTYSVLPHFKPQTHIELSAVSLDSSFTI